MSLMTTDQRVAANVRAELARRRVNQQALATAMGMGLMSISRRMSGQVSFSIAELYRVAEILKVDISALIALDQAVAS
ncbi:helix-turn-helix DNA binding domain protein [Mycobacterium phage prophiGD16-1]|uniref:helix-turn-helix domain-containing protein n=1 Tax=Mycobacteroides abscessus TaxID=36809 RepID=UPI000928ECF4|nr:helix-turn-helix transcriptional regulator [Mycobacteroides abscessus]QST88929.1 helix-turn-helix DNA binding domain protein [Mycobacterium phage prophiGD16-1]MBN7378399.1 helix-turn-helix transcriptional regulator [Mycobacteroides abscessus subsp. massiliense]SHX32926.1 putative toxin-antitoxin system, antitoxin component, Xre domain protein [Mycobacteroides abscessus subsp. abscessus]SHX51548.1 putative toxin-antitoxin system, antitoxin component, Xre domain protein [Mycobacteroides absces